MGQLVSRSQSPSDRCGQENPHPRQKPNQQNDICESQNGFPINFPTPRWSSGSQRVLAKSSDKADTQPRQRRSGSKLYIKEYALSKKSEKHRTYRFRRSSSRKKTARSETGLEFRQDNPIDAPRSISKVNSGPESLSSLASLYSLPTLSSNEGANERMVCIVCTNMLAMHRFPHRPPTAQCQHEVNACRKCLRTWIRSEFQRKVWDQINCITCSLHMQHEDMRAFASSDIFRRYDNLSMRTALEAIPDFTWCTARDCMSGHIHNVATNKFTCLACRKSHCLHHDIPWHKGETCREYDYRTNKMIKEEEEAASKKLIVETTRKCPRCSASIEKSYGCDHMTCSRCKHQFCWRCLASYSKIQCNCKHRENCRWYVRPEVD